MPKAKNQAEIVARLRRQVENDVPEAIASLGCVYRDGQFGFVKSTKKAAKLYKRGVELGNVQSMTNLGTLYENGDGVKLNRKKALQLYRMAVDGGAAQAAQNVGALIAHGQPDARGLVEAFEHFKLAADRGLHLSFGSVGFCYEFGEGVECDLDEARRWYTRLANSGNTREKEKAMRGLARLDGAR